MVFIELRLQKGEHKQNSRLHLSLWSKRFTDMGKHWNYGANAYSGWQGQQSKQAPKVGWEHVNYIYLFLISPWVLDWNRTTIFSWRTWAIFLWNAEHCIQATLSVFEPTETHNHKELGIHCDKTNFSNGRGIGKAIALQLAKAGFDVMRVRVKMKLSKLYKRFKPKQSLFNVWCKWAQYGSAEQDVEQHGAFYGVVLNAGMMALFLP